MAYINLQRWIRLIESTNVSNYPLVIAIVGNKLDLVDQRGEGFRAIMDVSNLKNRFDNFVHRICRECTEGRRDINFI